MHLRRAAATAGLECTARGIPAAAAARAERANSSRARFVAAASHDLLQPLSAAKLYLASLGEENTTELAARTVEKAHNALLSVEGILGALLDISRLESGHVSVDPGPVALGPIFAALRDEFTVHARLKGLKLRIVPTDAVVVSDRTYLRRILQNLISNAIRYTETGGVFVALRPLLETWGVTVLGVDTGEEALELIEATGLEPDACLIDFQLGDGIDGLTLVEALRHKLGPVPLRLITADRSEAVLKRAAAAQVEIFTKPTPTAQLAAFLFGSPQQGA